MVYRFADCVLDTQLYTLDRGGQSTRLAPKVFEVLCYLIAHRGRVVSKQELCDRVWEGLAITDAAMESCLRAVRLTVGDSGQAQRLIQTQRGHGYRFVADIALVPEDTPPAPPAPEAAPLSRTPSLVVPGVRPCAACQHANPEVATFCAACGTRLRQPCAHCGREMCLPATFCTACGQPLRVLAAPEPVAALAAAPALAPAGMPPPTLRSAGAERKLITVLCGTVASTAAGGGRFDLDTLYSVMQELHELAHDVARPYGGRLQLTMGDRLLIIFGVPEVHEDDARRAVRVALELQRRLQVHQECLETVYSSPLAFRIGLHTGWVVVGSRQDDAALSTIVGDVVSVARVLQEQAVPGQILCSGSTARLVQRAVRLEAVEPVQVSGQPTPVTTYAVLRNRSRRAPGWERWGRVLNPFVGRERECATLHALLTQVEMGRGQVVGVVGEPGIGKSRLLYEFRQSLVGQRLTYLTGRCLSYGSTTPYLPVLEVLRHHCGILETDRPEDIAAKLSRSLQEVGMAPEEWAPVLLPLFGVQEETTQSAPLSSEVRKARTLTAMTQMCLRGSRQCPLILEIEDLHWIDASSDECLTALVECMAGAAILILTTYRPGYRPPWVDKSYATQVSLAPLSTQDSLRVVQAVLPAAGQAAPLVPQLLAKAEGNPFFLEELARTVAEQGAAASSSTVPDTVQAVLNARMDRLPATAKLLLQAAAVIGKDVALPLLQAVTDMAEEVLHGDLRSLQAAEFLYETYALSAPIYTFTHVLTHEVAYGSLLQEQRRVLHARIVEALEAFAEDRVAEQVERLAHHALRGEVWDKALAYCRQAGEKAMARSAHREAVGSFEQALSALPHLPETRDTREQAIDLRFALSQALFPLLEFSQSLAYLREAEPLAEALDDQRRLGWLSASMSYCFWVMGDMEHAIAVGQRAQAIAETLGDGALQFEAYVHLGRTYRMLGDYRRAIEVLRRNVAAIDGAPSRARFGMPDPSRAVTSHAWLAACHAALGEFAEAIAIGEEAVRMAEAVDQPLSRIVAAWGVGGVSLAQGDVPTAISVLACGLEVCQLWDIHAYAPAIASALGASYTLSRRVDEALPLLEQYAFQGTVAQQSVALPRLSEAYLLAGRVEDAMRLAQHALDLCHVHRYRGSEAWVLRLLGEIHARHDPPQVAQAEAHYQQALALAEELGMRPLQAHCHLGLGRLYGPAGRGAQARAALSAAIELYRAMEMTFWLPQAEAALAQVEEE